MRWDPGGYIDIVTRGYCVAGPLDAVQSNVHFFPLYPYLVKFPTGFFLSAVYTESTYLCVLLAAWLMATRRRWAWAALFGALTALSRPPGVLLALPLALEYFSSIDWRPLRAHWGILAAAGPILGLALFLVLQMPISGDLLGPLKRTAWNMRPSWPWTTWLEPSNAAPGWVSIDRLSALLMLALLPLIERRFRSPALTAQGALATFAAFWQLYPVL